MTRAGLLPLATLLLTACGGAQWWRFGNSACPAHARLQHQVWTAGEQEVWCETADHRNEGRDTWLVQGRIARQFTFKDGVEHGPWVVYHPNGVKAIEGEYHQGARHGRWIAWDEQGHTRSVQSYDRGRPDGTWVDYHANGRSQQEKSFAQGLQTGRARWWDERGVLVWEELYQRGQRVSVVKRPVDVPDEPGRSLIPAVAGHASMVVGHAR